MSSDLLGELRSITGLKSELDRGFFFEIMKMVHDDPVLREELDGWLMAFLNRDMGYLKLIAGDQDFHSQAYSFLRFLVFDEFTVEPEFNDVQKDALKAKHIRLHSGLRDVRKCISENTKSVVCLGFNDDDVESLSKVLNECALGLSRLDFYNGVFGVDQLSQINGLYDGTIDELRIRVHKGPLFADCTQVYSGRFKFLLDSKISSFATSGSVLHSEDGKDIGEMIDRNPTINSVSFDGGIVDDFFLYNLIVYASFEPKLLDLSLRDCNVSSSGVWSLVESGFLSNCERFSLYNCPEIEPETISMIPIKLPNITNISLDSTAKFMLEGYLNRMSGIESKDSE